MAKPIFAIDQPGFMCSGDANAHAEKFAGPKSLFGPVSRFYVHGKLEIAMEFDCCDLIAGDFLDLPRQEAAIVDQNGELHDAVIIMVTSDQGNKYAFLVSPTASEEAAAQKCLWDGEWLRDGKEKYSNRGVCSVL